MSLVLFQYKQMPRLTPIIKNKDQKRYLQKNQGIKQNLRLKQQHIKSLNLNRFNDQQEQLKQILNLICWLINQKALKQSQIQKLQLWLIRMKQLRLQRKKLKRQRRRYLYLLHFKTMLDEELIHYNEHLPKKSKKPVPHSPVISFNYERIKRCQNNAKPLNSTSLAEFCPH